MPELPDIELYLSCLRPRIVGRELKGIRLRSPFLLRSAVPPVDDAIGRRVEEVARLGKRIVFKLDDAFFLVLHLMIAGRLRWAKAGYGIPGRLGQAAFDFPNGTLLITEAGTRKRASLYLVQGQEALSEHDPGGLEILEADLPAFTTRLRSRQHTLKRSLTDPRIFSGVGNAYSDEILFRAGLSPFKRTSQISDVEVARLFACTVETLTHWRDQLIEDVGDDFPKKVTAFRPGMAVHGRYKRPCPKCGSPIQRIVYASNEANYCATCQTDGKLLADRALSRLLREDWPRTLEELETRRNP